MEIFNKLVVKACQVADSVYFSFTWRLEGDERASTFVGAFGFGAYQVQEVEFVEKGQCMSCGCFNYNGMNVVSLRGFVWVWYRNWLGG
jgi:hypothetical protein